MDTITTNPVFRSGAATLLALLLLTAPLVGQSAHSDMVIVTDSTHDEWANESTWTVTGPEVPLDGDHLYLSAFVRINRTGHSARCDLILAIRNTEGWVESNFSERELGGRYEWVETQINGKLALGSAKPYHPKAGPHAVHETVPSPYAVSESTYSVGYLALFAGNPTVRMRWGEEAPFTVTSDAVGLLSALRSRLLTYRAPPITPSSSALPYCGNLTR